MHACMACPTHTDLGAGGEAPKDDLPYDRRPDLVHARGAGRKELVFLCVFLWESVCVGGGRECVFGMRTRRRGWIDRVSSGGWACLGGKVRACVRTLRVAGGGEGQGGVLGQGRVAHQPVLPGGCRRRRCHYRCCWDVMGKMIVNTAGRWECANQRGREAGRSAGRYRHTRTFDEAALALDGFEAQVV